jgi:hypothetical protein
MSSTLLPSSFIGIISLANEQDIKNIMGLIDSIFILIADNFNEYVSKKVVIYSNILLKKRETA